MDVGRPGVILANMVQGKLKPLISQRINAALLIIIDIYIYVIIYTHINIYIMMYVRLGQINNKMDTVEMFDFEPGWSPS